MKRHISVFLLVVILSIGAAVRFIGLGKNPAGIVSDEADAGYDAYSLLRTGKDQWGASWPITSFRGFGDYRLPGYTYFVIPSVSVFGLTPFAIRFPAALFGSLTILVVYFFVKELFRYPSDHVRIRGTNMLPLLSAFFLAVSPWHIGMSRTALEETTSVFFVTAGMLAVLKGRSGKYWIIAGAILCGFSLYLYTPNIILVPFLLVLTGYLYRHSYAKFRRQVLIGCLGFLIVIFPLLLFMGTSTAATRTRQINLTNDLGIVNTVNEKQGACNRIFPKIVCRSVFNKYSAFGTKFVSNYLNHFSPNLLGIYGTDSQYSILPGRGLLYVFDYPLLVLTLVVVCFTISPARLLLAAWLFFSAIPDSLTSDGQFGRFFVSYPMWPILIALGIITVVSYMKKWKLVIGLVCVLFLTSAGMFLVEYWTYFPYRYSQYTHFGYETLVGEIQTRLHTYDRIIVSNRVNDSKQYIYYLFYTKYDPAFFQSGTGITKVTESNGWVRVKKIQDVDFLQSLPGYAELTKTHVLLIGAPSEFPKTIPNVLPATAVPVEFTVKDLTGHILFEGVDSKKLYP